MIAIPKISDADASHPKPHLLRSNRTRFNPVAASIATSDAPRTLIIEQTEGSVERLRIGLELDGHDVTVSPDTRSTFTRMAGRSHDLIIFTGSAAGMPRRIQLVRAHDLEVLILAIASGGDETDLVMGLRLGADAYVAEPISVLETLARIDAMLRRLRPASAEDARLTPAPLTIGDVEIDERRHTVSKRGIAVALSPKELAVLIALARRDGEVVPRRELLDEAWDGSLGHSTRKVDMVIADLRRKLEDDPAEPRYIITEWKTGYRAAKNR